VWFAVAARNRAAAASEIHADEEDDLDDAWERLYREHRDELFRGACLLVGAHDAEEVVQDAFERAMREPGFFERIHNPGGWLRVAIARRALTRLRRRQRWQRVQLFLRPIAPPEPDLDLGRALTRLSAAQRTAVVLRYYHGLDYAEIAAVLGVSANAVGPILTRARTALREALR